MYLSEVNIWNFRKYGHTAIDDKNPSLNVKFKTGLNLLVGENDSGKTAIVDAIKYVLGTQSYDSNRLEENDFCCYKEGSEIKRAIELKIECVFSGFETKEAAKFIEWINLNDKNEIELRVRLTAKIKDGKIHSKITAGIDRLDILFDARDLLRTVYLKPLRDAEGELRAGYRSRFAQILKSHPLFITSSDEKHELENIAQTANNNISNYFKKDSEVDGSDVCNDGKEITEKIDEVLESFMGVDFKKYKSQINISDSELHKILSKLMLKIDENKVGLGSLNQLYMSMELLLLNVSQDFKLALIEEIEAHIHPQAQLRIIKYLQEIEDTQFIVTTHSVTLASVVDIENLILCRNKKAFTLKKGCTQLSEGDYEFLQRFLDATKSNLFFAKGVIMVEGDAENILIPAIANIIDRPLEMYGVSVVNIGNTAFLRYSNIFKRKGEENQTIGIPISIVTDLDVRPQEYYSDEDNKIKDKEKEKIYKIYKFKDIEVLKRQCKTLDTESDIRSYSSTSEYETKKELRRLLDIRQISNAVKEQYIEETRDYDEYKKNIRCSKLKKYEIDDIKLFINNWTMEYDIALGDLCKYIYASILIAQDISNNEETILSIDKKDYIEKAQGYIDSEFKDLSKDEIAYIVYKPLLNNKASKAVTSQYLASILNENKDEVKHIIEKDEYLKYIVDAIYHVTKPNEEVNVSE